MQEKNVLLYLPYLLNDKYIINERGRAFAIAHLIDGKTHKEIGELHNLSYQQVSNIINDCLDQIDLYRLGVIFSVNSFTSEIRETVLNSRRFNEEEKELIRNRKNKNHLKVDKVLDVDPKTVKKTTKKIL